MRNSTQYPTGPGTQQQLPSRSSAVAQAVRNALGSFPAARAPSLQVPGFALAGALAVGASPVFAAGGDFATTDFAAAAPFTYNHNTGGGAYNDRTTGDFNDITEQLEGGQFACGDIVTYLAQVEVEAQPLDQVQTIELDFRFLGNSTGQRGAALIDITNVAINYGQVENGDDGTGTNPGAGSFGTDSGISDDGGSTATLVSEAFVGTPFQSGAELLGTVEIDDLEAGEKVVLRIDTKLACDPGTSPTGNLQGQLDGGRVVSPVQETINTGQQTIPFLRIGDIEGAGEPLLRIVKTVTTLDGTCGVDDVEMLGEDAGVVAGDTVKYCYVVSNPGTADLFDIGDLVDDNGTPLNDSDDFYVMLSGLQNLDGDGDAGDLAGGSTAAGEELVTLFVGGEVVNTVEGTGNNGRSGGNFAELTATDTATVNVAGAPNQPPNPLNDFVSPNEDTAVTIPVTGNDSDPDGNLDPTSATTECSECSLPSNGTLVNNGDGTFSYTPNANFDGTDSFVYQVCDTEGLCDTATVTIQMNPVNDPPIAADDAYSTNEDEPLTIPAPGVLNNDSDVEDGNALTVTVQSGPSHGTLTQNSDGSFTYTPDENFNGTDSYTYQACDSDGACDTATVTITVNPVNDAPDALDDNAAVNEDDAVVIPVLGNDSDPDGDALSVTNVSDPANGTTTINPDGTVTYKPDPNFCGEDSFTYTVSDGNGGTDNATVSVDVACVNDPPVANDDTAVTDEDLPVAIEVLDNDSDADGDALTVIAVSDPPNGTATISNGTVTYTPDPDYNGDDSFTYTISDGNGGTDTATVTVTIGALNDPPVANDDSATTAEDTPVTINVAGNDSDVDGNLDPSSTTVLDGPEHGTLVNNGDGTFSYTPDPDYNGPDSFTYQICDTDGVCDSATVTIDVTPVNDAPVAEDDAYSTNEDTALTISSPGVLANDSDVDGDTLTATVQSGPSNGTLTQNADGSFTYTPNANFNGADSYTYTVSDGNGGTDTATVTIDVTPVNDAPVAEDNAYSTNEDTVLTIPAPGVLGNDSDVDGDSLSVDSYTQPANGTLVQNADGSFTYTPNANFNGADSYTYTVSDGNGGTDTATVTITVNPVNDLPVAVDDAYSTQQDTPLTLDPSGAMVNDSDVDGDALSVTGYDGASAYGGSVAMNVDGSFTYTPAPGFAGIDTYTYTISDGNGGYDTATVTITVEARNNRSISVDLQSFDLFGSVLSGALHVTNQSNGYDVQVTDLEILVQYRNSEVKQWTDVAVDGCMYSPEPNFLLVDEAWVDFDNCQLAEAIPAGSTVRVTAKVKIFGRIKGVGKSDGWFLSRLSQKL